MTADTLPANVTLRAAVPVTLDGSQVQRDWRHLGAEFTGSFTAVTAVGAIYSTHIGVLAAAWTLAAITSAGAVTCLVFLILMRREGRRWTYAITDDPA
jgi:hypothetical protein